MQKNLKANTNQEALSKQKQKKNDPNHDDDWDDI